MPRTPSCLNNSDTRSMWVESWVRESRLVASLVRESWLVASLALEAEPRGTLGWVGFFFSESLMVSTSISSSLPSVSNKSLF